MLRWFTLKIFCIVNLSAVPPVVVLKVLDRHWAANRKSPSNNRFSSISSGIASIGRLFLSKKRIRLCPADFLHVQRRCDTVIRRSNVSTVIIGRRIVQSLYFAIISLAGSRVHRNDGESFRPIYRRTLPWD